MTASDPGGLYDGQGNPLGSTTLPFDGPHGAIASRPSCRLLFDPMKFTTVPQHSDAAWCLPVGPNPLPIPPDVLAVLVAQLDGGGVVVLFAESEDAIDVAISAVSALAGGGHA